MGNSQPDNWTLSEIFLDLLQDKLLNFQKFYDLSVDERDALETEKPEALAKILQDKSKLQQKINQADHQLHRLEKRHPKFVTQMNEEQKIEMRGTIQMVVELLQNIIDYEESNKQIAREQKLAIREELEHVNQGSKLLQNYLGNPSENARYINKAQ